MTSTFAIVILFLLYQSGDADDYNQEAAKVIYSNSAYIKDVNIFTFRRARKSPYLTSCNATTTSTWDNNVTVIAECYNARTKQEIFTLDFKICDVMKVSWIKEWLKQYSNVPIECPVLPQKYMFRDIEVPPKNFPIPLPTGEYNMGVTFITTKNKVKILELRGALKATGKKFG